MKPFARPISAGIVACIVLSVGVAVALASTVTVDDGSVAATASLRACDGPVSSEACFISPAGLTRCPSLPSGRYCTAVSAFIGDAQALRLVRHAYLKQIFASLQGRGAMYEGKGALYAQAGRLGKALPVLRKRQTEAEANQLAALRDLAIPERSSLLIRRALQATEARLTRARRFYYDSASGESEYVVPGANGAFCTLNVDKGRISRMGCSKVGSSVEQNGTIAMSVTKGGYELSGLLPRGARRFRILDGKHDIREGSANRWGGFAIAGKGVLLRFEARMQSGEWRVIVDTPFPSPPRRRQRAPSGHAPLGMTRPMLRRRQRAPSGHASSSGR